NDNVINVSIHTAKRKSSDNIEAKNIKFKNEDTQVIIKLMDGSFPEVHRLIPDTHNTRIVIYDTKEFTQIIKDAALITKNEKNNVINFKILDGKLKVSSESPENGSYENTINLYDVQGEDLTISMNGKYLQEGIKQLGKKERLHFGFSGSMRPFIINPID